MIPGHLCGEVFGELGRVLGKAWEAADRLRPNPGVENMWQPAVQDTMAIDPQTIWEVKGPPAPSAVDLGRRVEVLDLMGIERQLVFPTSANYAMIIGAMSDVAYAGFFGGDVSMFGDLSRQEFAKRFVRVYNEWVLDNPTLANGRIRLVGVLPTGPDLSEIIRTATELVDGGARAVFMNAHVPPGGVSPAHSALDPLWALFEAHDVAVTLHIGSDLFLLDPAWCNAEPFGELFQSPEVPLANIQMFSTAHMAVENYLSALVLGGVFERFPRLRVGLLEVGGYWVGPAARRMDMYVDVFSNSSTAKLPMKPSEYVARNVRVSPFNFEPVQRYFEDDPNLADVYCYSTDYPHVEGQKNSMRKMLARVEPLGEQITTKYFRTNAEWLLPDSA